MRLPFPLFQSHLDLAHHYWEQILQPNDWAIDATCGNGHDTLKLAHILNNTGGVIALDLQQQAIDQTTSLLQSHLSPEKLPHIHLFHQSHVEFPPLAYQHPIRLIVYNLGYLPKGNKQLTTLTSTTLSSLKRALQLIVPGGMISLTCYPGHAEGAKEQQALIQELSQLSPHQWNVCQHTFLNRFQSPNLILIQKVN
jgi:hypothetical protein